MNRLLGAIWPFRKYCETSAVLLFVFFWPISNLYFVISAGLVVAGKVVGINSTVGGILGVIGIFMAFLTPLWAIAVVGTFYLATVVTIASCRPVPMVLLLVAWLELENLIPVGHIQLGDLPRIFDAEFSWFCPLLYSALTILGGALVVMAKQRDPYVR